VSLRAAGHADNDLSDPIACRGDQYIRGRSVAAQPCEFAPELRHSGTDSGNERSDPFDELCAMEALELLPRRQAACVVHPIEKQQAIK